MKKITIILSLSILFMSCGGNGSEIKTADGGSDMVKTSENGNPTYDPQRGEGKFTKVEVGASLDTAMATSGEKIYAVKCGSCHKTTDEKLVGPGWKGVTSRHTAEWIMNFATNTDAMINKDPKAQAMLEICLVRMPNQNLSDEEARSVFEFMRKNDGVK